MKIENNQHTMTENNMRIVSNSWIGSNMKIGSNKRIGSKEWDM